MSDPVRLSYLGEAWREFRRQPLALAALALAAFVVLVAMYAPLLANNRPLAMRAALPSDYRDAVAVAAEQVLIDSPQSLQLTNRALEAMVEHLPPDRQRGVAELLSEVIAGPPAAPRRQELSSIIMTYFDHPVEPVLRFPAFRALSRIEIAVMLLLPLGLLLRAGARRLGGTGVLLLTLILGFGLASVLRVYYPPIKDSRSYRRILTQPGFGERGFALMAPVPYGENENIIADARKAPSWLGGADSKSNWHWLGTDTNGRDVLARMIYGARVSILVGVLSVGLYTIIGMVLGALAGFYGGWVDLSISRLLEFVICFPVLMVILAVQAFLAPSLWNLIVALALLWWTGVARLQRAEFLRLVNEEYIHAVRALGGGDLRIMVLHLIPNSLAPILVVVSFGIAGSIVVESALSFLGFGVPQPMASWGDLLNNGRNDVQGLWWLTIFPGLAIFLTVTCFNLVGEAIRDALDPRRAP